MCERVLRDQVRRLGREGLNHNNKQHGRRVDSGGSHLILHNQTTLLCPRLRCAALFLLPSSSLLSRNTFTMDDARVDFDINEWLKNYSIDPASIATPEAPSELTDCENDPESLTPAVINSCLNPVVDAIAANPEAITRSACFDTLQFLLKCVPIKARAVYRTVPNYALFRLSRSSSQIPVATLAKILDLIVSSLSAQADVIHADLESDDQYEQDTIQHYKQLLEMYAFLLRWTILAVETRALEKPAAVPARGRGKGAKAKAGAVGDSNWDPSSQLQKALETMSKVLKLKLVRIFVTTSERDTFIDLFARPVYHILENEARVKVTAIRMHCFRVLCIAIKHHGHGFGEESGSGERFVANEL